MLLETIQWWPTVGLEGLPDADTTVLLLCPGADEPVWPGYHDGESWLYVEGGEAKGVTHWAHFPNGPAQGGQA